MDFIRFRYSQDYKHFDNLIWQLPSWSAGVFLLTISSIGIHSLSNVDTIINNRLIIYTKQAFKNEKS